MTKRELIQKLEELDCPDDAEVLSYDEYTITEIAYYEARNEINLS